MALAVATKLHLLTQPLLPPDSLPTSVSIPESSVDLAQLPGASKPQAAAVGNPAMEQGLAQENHSTAAGARVSALSTAGTAAAAAGTAAAAAGTAAAAAAGAAGRTAAGAGCAPVWHMLLRPGARAAPPARFLPRAHLAAVLPQLQTPPQLVAACPDSQQTAAWHAQISNPSAFSVGIPPQQLGFQGVSPNEPGRGRPIPCQMHIHVRGMVKQQPSTRAGHCCLAVDRGDACWAAYDDEEQDDADASHAAHGVAHGNASSASDLSLQQLLGEAIEAQCGEGNGSHGTDTDMGEWDDEGEREEGGRPTGWGGAEDDWPQLGQGLCTGQQIDDELPRDVCDTDGKQRSRHSGQRDARWRKSDDLSDQQRECGSAARCNAAAQQLSLVAMAAMSLADDNSRRAGAHMDRAECSAAAELSTEPSCERRRKKGSSGRTSVTVVRAALPAVIPADLPHTASGGRSRVAPRCKAAAVSAVAQPVQHLVPSGVWWQCTASIRGMHRKEEGNG
ncbi:hypothetical protein QJQ45_005978 [Haematococcus lacustris]|nr:hypothetical protein QJQ45_005978 [Haematococcus lacustris]